MKRHILILSFLIFSIQLIACNPKNIWENYFKSDDVSSVEAVSNTSVEVVFKNEVEQASAENPANYAINTGLTVVSVARDNTDFTKVMLTTSSQQDVEYTLIVTNVKTSNGRTVDTTKNPDKFIGYSLLGIVNVIATSNTGVDVVFTKIIDPAEGEIAANYSIPGLTVTAADYDSSQKTVHLTTSTQSYTIYTLTVTSVTDMDGNGIEPSMSYKDFQGYLFCITSVNSVNNTHVDVVFSNNVDLTSAQDELNYSIDNSLNVLSASRDITDNKIVHLETGPQSEIDYAITINDVESVNSEIITAPWNSSTFFGDALPKVTGITRISFNSIEVIFSEDVETMSSNNENNYSIIGSDSSVLDVSSAVTSGVSVTLMTDYQAEIMYTVTVLNVKDFTGNIIDPANNTGSFSGDARPAVDIAAWDMSGNVANFIVNFTEAVNESEALNPGNYSITNLLSIWQIIKIDNATYELITDYQTEGSLNYELSVSSIHDLTGNEIDSSILYQFDGKDCPYIINVVYIDPNEIDVVFSDNIYIVSAQTISNYSISGGITVSGASRYVSPNENRVRLYLASDLSCCTPYTLTITNIYEEIAGPAAGNLIRKYNSIDFTRP